MEKKTKIDPKKGMKHEAKGDKLISQGKLEKGFKEYLISESLNPNRPEIYEKLIQTRHQIEEEWNQQDFTDLMTWTMRQQELLHPELEQVYETLTPDYQEIQKLLQQLMMIDEEGIEQTLIKKILSYGEKSILPTLNFLLSLKSSSKGNS